MEKLKKHFGVIIITVILFLTMGYNVVLATEEIGTLQKLDYSEEYKKWIGLSEEERKKVMQPRMFEVVYENSKNLNPIFELRKASASGIAKYSLKDTIPNNVIIKNQQQTNECWTFATISSLETNLALANYKNNKNTSKVYDYSERHMDYSTSKTFLNNEINTEGYNREVGTGGNWAFAETYLTSGNGAIDENLMPFENNEDIIDISKIKNKKVSSQVYDTIAFADYKTATETNAIEIKNQIKQHIKNYGAVYASIHGNSLNDSLFPCYNNETGAKYCKNTLLHRADHAVSIIGWDDNYSITNFPEDARPTSAGAWIVRNSWGEKYEITYTEVKEMIFEGSKDQCIQEGWNSAEEIPDEQVEKLATNNGYSIDQEHKIIYKKIGDNGLMYISYEDCNISKGMYGIINAKDYINYENIYQYDKFYPTDSIGGSFKNVLMCNIFEKKTKGKEYLTQISLQALQQYTCKVYVNPNGESKLKKDLQEVMLKAGKTETIQAGYNTLEFETPIEIKGSKFAIVVEVEGKNNSIYIPLENNAENIDVLNQVEVEKEKCFIAIGNDLENCTWSDLGNISKENAGLADGDSTIKAFTTSKIIDESVKNLEIVTPPTKTKYFEGENFDKTGMVVKANFNNDTSEILDSSSYNISNGTNLKTEQTSVTISYENKSVNQPITVEKNNVTELKITTPPTKINYKEGEDFDKTGMTVEAKFKNGTSKTIADYKIENGNALKLNQTSVTISYDDIKITQAIKVEPNPLVEISITKEPIKTKYVVGQNFDKTGMVVTASYESGLKRDIEDYSIENGEKLTKGQEAVIIKYQEKTTTQKITVEERTVTQIAINKKPTKLTYIKEKEELDLTGGTIKAIYNDGETETVEMKSENVNVIGFSNKKAGKITITVEYQNKTVKFEVDIVEPKVNEEEKPNNTDFGNAECQLLKLAVQYDSTKTEELYSYITVEIDKISVNKNNDRVEYYYHLSSEANEKNINVWTKITEEQKYDDKLIFNIDLKNLPNSNAISNNGNIYVYVKEVAIKGGNQSVAISKGIELRNDKMTENIKENTNEDKKQNNTEKTEIQATTKDSTTATKQLPKTGIKVTIIAIGILVIILGSYVYIRYKNLNKYIK